VFYNPKLGFLVAANSPFVITWRTTKPDETITLPLKQTPSFNFTVGETGK